MEVTSLGGGWLLGALPGLNNKNKELPPWGGGGPTVKWSITRRPQSCVLGTVQSMVNTAAGQAAPVSPSRPPSFQRFSSVAAKCAGKGKPAPGARHAAGAPRQRGWQRHAARFFASKKAMPLRARKAGKFHGKARQSLPSFSGPKARQFSGNAFLALTMFPARNAACFVVIPSARLPPPSRGTTTPARARPKACSNTRPFSSAPSAIRPVQVQYNARQRQCTPPRVRRAVRTRCVAAMRACRRRFSFLPKCHRLFMFPSIQWNKLPIQRHHQYHRQPSNQRAKAIL